MPQPDSLYMWKHWGSNTLLFLLTTLRKSSVSQIVHIHKYSQRGILRNKLTQEQKKTKQQKDGRAEGLAGQPGLTPTSQCQLLCFSGPRCPFISYKPEPFSPRIMTHLSTWQGKRFMSRNLHPGLQIPHWMPWIKIKGNASGFCTSKDNF